MHLRTSHALVLLIAVSTAVTLLELPSGTRLTLAALSLAAGVSALTVMGAAALLGGRIKLVESLLGGLDRCTSLTSGSPSLPSALRRSTLHFLRLDSWQMAPIVELPRFLTRLVRQLSFLALMLIVMLALNRRIPYSAWRWWHKLSGPLSWS